MAFSFRLSELKKRKGLTNTELAAMMGVTEGSIRNYLHGTTLPDIAAISNLASTTKVDLNWLVAGDVQPKSSAAQEDSELYRHKEPIAGIGRRYVDRIEAELNSLNERISFIERSLSPTKENQPV